MRDALNATGWPMLFSMCEWGVDDPASWAPQVANSWRTTPDIKNHWASVISNIDHNDASWAVAGPGQFNDADMYEAFCIITFKLLLWLMLPSLVVLMLTPAPADPFSAPKPDFRARWSLALAGFDPRSHQRLRPGLPSSIVLSAFTDEELLLIESLEAPSSLISSVIEANFRNNGALIGGAPGDWICPGSDEDECKKSVNRIPLPAGQPCPDCGHAPPPKSKRQREQQQQETIEDSICPECSQVKGDSCLCALEHESAKKKPKQETKPETAAAATAAAAVQLKQSKNSNTLRGEEAAWRWFRRYLEDLAITDPAALKLLAPKLKMDDERTWIASTDMLAGFTRWRHTHGAGALNTLMNTTTLVIAQIKARCSVDSTYSWGTANKQAFLPPNDIKGHDHGTLTEFTTAYLEEQGHLEDAGEQPALPLYPQDLHFIFMHLNGQERLGEFLDELVGCAVMCTYGCRVSTVWHILWKHVKFEFLTIAKNASPEAAMASAAASRAESPAPGAAAAAAPAAASSSSRVATNLKKSFDHSILHPTLRVTNLDKDGNEEEIAFEQDDVFKGWREADEGVQHFLLVTVDFRFEKGDAKKGLLGGRLMQTRLDCTGERKQDWMHSAAYWLYLAAWNVDLIGGDEVIEALASRRVPSAAAMAAHANHYVVYEHQARATQAGPRAWHSSAFLGLGNAVGIPELKSHGWRRGFVGSQIVSFLLQNKCGRPSTEDREAIAEQTGHVGTGPMSAYRKYEREQLARFVGSIPSERDQVLANRPLLSGMSRRVAPVLPFTVPVILSKTAGKKNDLQKVLDTKQATYEAWCKANVADLKLKFGDGRGRGRWIRLGSKHLQQSTKGAQV